MARSVLVTGAADGIGRGIATCFAEHGDRVALLDYDVDKLERTAAELRGGGRQVLALQADVRDAAALQAAVARAVEAHDGLDVAVNNAAVYPNTPVVEMAEEEWDRVMDTNLKGAFLFTRAAARQMLRQGRGGKLCPIASGAYKPAPRRTAHYCPSKTSRIWLPQTGAHALPHPPLNPNPLSRHVHNIAFHSPV